jgi:branched-chain amino acid transport system permease protein
LLGLRSQWLDLVVMLTLATLAMAVLGMAIARYFVLPLRAAPPLNTLLITLMLGTALRESN